MPRRRPQSLRARRRFESGHEYDVEIVRRADPETGRPEPVEAQVTVLLEHATPWVRVTLENWATRLSKWLGLTREIEVGEEGFDARFLLQTRKRDRARELLVNDALQQAIHAAFSAGVRELELGPGIRASVPLHDYAGTRVVAILDALERAALALERPPFAVKLLPGERRAMAGEGGRPHCPYCRDELTGEETDLVSCRLCRTVLHDECWQELGRCPVLGCRGRNPERPRPANKRGALRRRHPRRGT